RVGAVVLFPRGNEPLVLRIIEIGIVMMHGDQPDRGVTHGLQLDILGDIAGSDQLDASSAHAERAVGLGHRNGMIACRYKYEKNIRLLILGALKERREIRNRAGTAGRNGVDYLTAIGFEAGFEGI